MYIQQLVSIDFHHLLMWTQFEIFKNVFPLPIQEMGYS